MCSSWPPARPSLPVPAEPAAGGRYVPSDERVATGRRRRRPAVLARAGPAGARRRARALPAAAGAGEGVVLLRGGRDALRRLLAGALPTARGRAARRPRPAGRARVPDAALSPQGRHGRLAQRLVGHVRRRPPAGAVLGHVLPRAGGAALRGRGARPRRAGVQGARAGGPLRPARPAAGRRLGAAGAAGHAGRHPRRLRPAGRPVHRAGARRRSARPAPPSSSTAAPARCAGSTRGRRR